MTSRARRRRRGWLVLPVVVGVLGAGAWAGTHLVRSVQSPECTITASGVTESFDPDQTANAALIAAIAVERGMPARAATIALTTAFQESKIRNLRFGDRDSLGLFQQRPSQGWGTEQQILDPVHATNAFYDALVKFKGYENADITTIAQRVQRSGFPEAYRDHEGQGRVLASTLTGYSPAGLTCRLDPATEHAKPSTVAADLREQMGVTRSTAGAGTLTVTAADERQAWAVGHWAVARAETYGAKKVSVGARTWDRDAGADGWSDGAASTTVTVTLR
ncbi:hypothetical protein [Terracoccus luteus]|uniref:Heavy metal transporter n=1 Tax=Terracoccus luteus TaxID=53356 RepID=A0A839PSZ1_9MICO|nr:hypothetical protein [Terracoccus luteus]MBB2985884.1 hypothetical protein [Terracoccus luteus]MCP2171536.1 hypothetical protein [Terracoccus luteus]